jgi:hypothetical protein
MKLSQLNVGTIYGVVPSWGYNNSSARDVNKCRENDLVKAELISLDKYVYQPSSRYPDQTNFKLAPQGDRSVGVLMKATDNGKDFYWTARLADIVEEWGKLEPVWNSRNTEQAERERIENEKREKAEAFEKKIYAHAQRCEQSVPNAIKDLVGNRVGGVRVSVNGRGESAVAVVTLSLADMETLIETFYDKKEQVA